MSNRSEQLSFSCLYCGACAVSDKEIQYVFHYGAENSVEITVTMPVLACEQCKSEFIDWRGEQIIDDAIYRHRLGLLTPSKIRGIRKRYGLSQAELARLTGFGERSIKRWERGALLQNASADRFLRLIDSDPRVIGKLRRIAERLAK